MLMPGYTVREDGLADRKYLTADEAIRRLITASHPAKVYAPDGRVLLSKGKLALES